MSPDDRIHALVAAGGITVARQSGLFRLSSLDGTAQNLYQGWRPDVAIATLALAVADDIILAGIAGGVARSDDGGESWRALQFRVPPPLVTCLALSPDFARDGVALAGSFEDGIFRSDDGGESFGAFSFGLFDHNVYCLALSPAFTRDGLAFAGTGSGVYRSDNGGRYWRDLSLPAGDETVLSLALSPNFDADGIIYAGTEAHGLLRSDDGGDRWRRMADIGGAVDALLLAEDDDSRLYALADDALLRSDDGGDRWQTLLESNVAAIAFAGDGRSLLLGMASGDIDLRLG